MSYSPPHPPTCTHSTDYPHAVLAEVERAANDLHAYGYAVTCHYDGVYLT
jgi:hypothetical protein